MTKIAINGFGRIGRSVFRRILEKHPDLEIGAINDLTDNRTLAHLLKYDSNYGIYAKSVSHNDQCLKVEGQEFKCMAEKDPANLPWQKLSIDIVLECTGCFAKLEDAQKHLEAGAKKVIISAPSKSEDVSHLVMGVNEDKYDSAKDKVVSMASCTTNCLAPVVKILDDQFEIESGLMTTIHSYTNGQRLLDAPHRDLRRARAAALSMVPTTTGATVAVIKTLPQLKGKISGLAIRVPTSIVSIVDFVTKVKKDTDVEGVNKVFKEIANKGRLKGILDVEEACLVSVDYRNNPFSAIIDLTSTMVQNKNLVKVLAWYDNEWAYACRLAELTQFIGKKL
ncbi:MAG: type I glyceraldehyde-3-phosphate dehydrogenase [Parcubacteria group bacterium]|jgi:glyceraldehyde 3-phosphate dehydrogenase|nr:type I glyceraldehyde-3-phosphate dehydrogenase [Parcubacteria group bacterium]|tara:strand:+ start:10268 stop:11278 length:1011 start_codon:yes stop_codon:yes gene_type:complete